MPLYIGLMSGTSLDGVDGVLAQWPEDATADTPPREEAFVHLDFAPALRAELMALNANGPDELHRAALAANAVARTYADAVASLLERSGADAATVGAIGAHGQTVRHRPRHDDGTGYTLQLLNGALLAERCDIDVVCDFRARDVAAGGQGAPLVPAFHAAAFGDGSVDVAVLNVGGIANLTLLPAGGAVRGFDTGPGNMLMDLWCERHLGRPYDAGGAWAARGRVLEPMLRTCLSDPYFGREPPKSTGRDLFDADWLIQHVPTGADAADVACTLAELTAVSAAQALRRHAPRTRRLLVCGGGARNAHLMRRLAAKLAPTTAVHGSEVAGIAPEHVEALAFAWLARAFVARRPGNLPAVTGAAGPRVLGALYPAGLRR